VKPCNDYPVTFAYKAQDGKYYGPNGSVGLYHRGEDRACPTGSPINVEGVTIGLVGATGLASGPHLHFQCMSGSSDVDPVPYRFRGGTVTTAGWHTQFGNQVRITQPNGIVAIYAHLSKINVTVGQKIGGSMAENITDDVARQIGWHYLGRNGFDGKPNALQSAQGDLQGKPLTNAQLSAWFLSAESRDWRDSRIHKVYGERDALRTANTNLNAQVTQLTKAVADKQKTIDLLNAQVLGLNQTINEKQAEIDTLADANADLKKENDELKAQLATCGDSEDTDFLNKLGELLRWLIARLGVKK
jgi:uncharacterized protein YoxC